MDYGFAPNPFHGICTLACCKSQTRRVATLGDIIVGTTSPTNSVPKIRYIMRVTGVTSFQNYWESECFESKKVVPRGGEMLRNGDNIYHKCEVSGEWLQEESRHSNGKNQTNFKHRDIDTGVDRVLLSTDFVYFGINAIDIPMEFRHFADNCDLFGDQKPIDLVAITRFGKGYRSHKKICEIAYIRAFEVWFKSLGNGIKGLPSNWSI